MSLKSKIRDKIGYFNLVISNKVNQSLNKVSFYYFILTFIKAYLNNRIG